MDPGLVPPWTYLFESLFVGMDGPIKKLGWYTSPDLIGGSTFDLHEPNNFTSPALDVWSHLITIYWTSLWIDNA